jgi:GTP cyclohydrolase I
MMRILTHDNIAEAARSVAEAIRADIGGAPCVYPIPRGGVSAAYAVQRFLPDMYIIDNPDNATCFIDDLIDSGATMAQYMEAYPERPFFALFNKAHMSDDWLVFPWEGSDEKSADDIPVRLLQFIGEDPTRGGLLETPKRFLKAWREYSRGYNENASDLLKVFEDGAEKCDEMVLVKDIPVYSHCEHHLAPFFGVAHVAYIPNGKIVGLSKLSRLVDMFAKRLQVQERLTNQIADALEEHLHPLGVGVVIECRHMCMESRGIQRQGASTVTSAMRGALHDEPSARAEFLSLIK